MSSSEVVGINTALVGPWAGQGLGMAVPVNERTRTIIGTLSAGRPVRRAYLGIGGGSRPLPPPSPAPPGPPAASRLSPSWPGARRRRPACGPAT